MNENVEIVRRSVTAFDAGDWAAALADYAPGVEWIEMPSLGPDAATYVGREQLRAAAESWVGMWTEYAIEVEEYREVGAEVVVLVRERASGGASGARVARELGEVFTLRDGQVMRVRLYGSWGEALDAAGVDAPPT